ncbi:hypothetical protein RRG08_033547 [Elysia crispata]|uniref:Uncharacterized protein n=1 Tax=Elysia crispata TaxID=231223 RepID=A0AAE1CJH8_9GAST|nr:hypothetical protein RRG08_033547 [Elysia crispata]
MAQKAAVLCMVLVMAFTFLDHISAHTEETTWLQTLFSPACSYMTYLMDEVFCTGSSNAQCDLVLWMLRYLPS